MIETPLTEALRAKWIASDSSNVDDKLGNEILNSHEALERDLAVVTKERRAAVAQSVEVQMKILDLAKASKSLVHYIKLARQGDSPLIQATLVESIDLAVAKVEESLNNIPTATKHYAQRPTTTT